VNKLKNKKVLYAILIVVGIFIITGIYSMLFNKINREKIEKQYIEYGEFIEDLELGRIDLIKYDKTENFMELYYFNKDTDNMPLVEREKYKYSKAECVYTLYPGGEDFRKQVLEYGVRLEGLAADSMDILLAFISAIPTIFLIVILIYSFKMMGKMMGTNPLSSAVVDVTEHPDVKFADVIGHEEVLEDIKFIVKLLKNPELGKDMNVRAPKGILLTGEPGTGKTLIAKAMAGEADVPFLYMNASSFVELYVGMGARRVRELFKKAKAQAPCIVFIDEIDAVGASRDGPEGNSERQQTLNALLQEMDGFTSNQDIFIIAATNTPEKLDKALVRSGRFDREIVVSKPRSWKVRKELFEHFVKSINNLDNIDYDKLSKETVGFTGADIKAVTNEAALTALTRDSKKIEMCDFEEAIDKKILKGNKKKKSAQEEEKERNLVAWHESGHAVVAFLKGKPIARATISGTTSGVGGFVLHEDDGNTFETKDDFETEIMISYGGRISEEIKYGFQNVSIGASNDIQQVTARIQAYVGVYGFDRELGAIDLNQLMNNGLIDKSMIYNKISDIANKLYNDTYALLNENFHLVDKLAETLLEVETLSGDDIHKLLSTSDFVIDEKRKEVESEIKDKIE